MNLLIIGPQGSGKGTQGKKLSEMLGLKIIEMGQILRSQAEQDNPLSHKIKELLDNGVLLPPEIINATIDAYLTNLNKTDGLIFDAYPRQIEQWNFLREWVVLHQTKIDAAIVLELDDSKCIERLENRVMSKSTGEIFNYVSYPPPGEWSNEDLIVRDDDKPESVKRRLEQYRTVTTPLLEMYKKDNILISIDASGSIEEVFALILEGLKTRNLITL